MATRELERLTISPLLMVLKGLASPDQKWKSSCLRKCGPDAKDARTHMALYKVEDVDISSADGDATQLWKTQPSSSCRICRLEHDDDDETVLRWTLSDGTGSGPRGGWYRAHELAISLSSEVG
jgi:hypothetical protein